MSDATCSIDGCDSPKKARGWCVKHWARWKRHGDPLHLARPVLGPDVLCTMDNCDDEVVGLGLCRKHYQRQWMHGDPSVNLRPELEWTPEERFWSKINKDGPVPAYAPDLGPCWIWLPPTNGNGYGQIWIDTRLVMAHRYSYELARGPIPEDLELDHLCRVPRCVNPSHLEPVTGSVNVRRGADARIIERGGKCVNGHDMTPDNIYWNKQDRPVCKTCVREAQQRYQERKGNEGRAA